LISFDANKYSIPFVYAGKEVLVRKVKGRIVKIFSLKWDLIASHLIPNSKYNVIKDKEHYKGLNKSVPKSLGQLKSEFIQYFEGCQPFLDGLLANKSLSPVNHLKNILLMRSYYSDQNIKNALSKCIAWDRYSSRIVIPLLRGGSKVSPSNLLVTNTKLQELILETSDIKVNLRDYEDIK
jgi:hypothetical protein